MNSLLIQKYMIRLATRSILLKQLEVFEIENNFRIQCIWRDELGQKIRRLSVDYLIGYRCL
jgi:hypothetical protein